MEYASPAIPAFIHFFTNTAFKMKHCLNLALLVIMMTASHSIHAQSSITELLDSWTPNELNQWENKDGKLCYEIHGWTKTSNIPYRHACVGRGSGEYPLFYKYVGGEIIVGLRQCPSLFKLPDGVHISDVVSIQCPGILKDYTLTYKVGEEEHTVTALSK